MGTPYNPPEGDGTHWTSSGFVQGLIRQERRRGASDNAGTTGFGQECMDVAPLLSKRRNDRKRALDERAPTLALRSEAHLSKVSVQV